MSAQMRAQTEQWWDQRVEYDPSAESYHVACEPTELVSTNVVLSVAAIEDASPTSLPPLAATVDPDAIDDLFVGDVEGRISFCYFGYDVTIHNDGRLSIVPHADGARRRHRN